MGANKINQIKGRGGGEILLRDYWALQKKAKKLRTQIWGRQRMSGKKKRENGISKKKKISPDQESKLITSRAMYRSSMKSRRSRSAQCHEEEGTGKKWEKKRKKNPGNISYPQQFHRARVSVFPVHQ